MAKDRILEENLALREALRKAYDMLCEQEDALRSLGAYEPDAESAILTAKALLTSAPAVVGERQPQPI